VGLRISNKKEFPPKYRENILNAEQTYINGDPNKGVANIMDQIEALTRIIAIKAKTLRLFGSNPPNETQINTMSWAILLKKMETDIDRSAPSKCHDLHETLLAKIRGFTEQRNQSAHVPKNRAELLERDRTLRTRMEYATDSFRELLMASRKLHL
jgi:hypothetical protein